MLSLSLSLSFAFILSFFFFLLRKESVKDPKRREELMGAAEEGEGTRRRDRYAVRECVTLVYFIDRLQFFVTVEPLPNREKLSRVHPRQRTRPKAGLRTNDDSSP